MDTPESAEVGKTVRAIVWAIAAVLSVWLGSRSIYYGLRDCAAVRAGLVQSVPVEDSRTYGSGMGGYWIRPESQESK